MQATPPFPSSLSYFLSYFSFHIYIVADVKFALWIALSQRAKKEKWMVFLTPEAIEKHKR